MQAFVLQKAVTNTIRIIPQLTQKKILMQKEDRQEKQVNAGSPKNDPGTVKTVDGRASEEVGDAGKASDHSDVASDETALDMYVRVIDYNLLAPLRQDARISEDILSQVRQIFLALPAGIQARVLLTGIRHVVEKDLAAEAAEELRLVNAVAASVKAGASQQDSVTELSPNQELAAEHEASPEQRDSAVLAKKLLSAGGVVAVKLAQMLAEDPKIPRESVIYRCELGSCTARRQPGTHWSVCETVGIVSCWEVCATAMRQCHLQISGGSSRVPFETASRFWASVSALVPLSRWACCDSAFIGSSLRSASRARPTEFRNRCRHPLLNLVGSYCAGRL